MTIEEEPLCTNMARVALGGGYDYAGDDDAEDGTDAVDRDPCGRDDANDTDGDTLLFLVADMLRGGTADDSGSTMLVVSDTWVTRHLLGDLLVPSSVRTAPTDGG